MRWIFKLVGVVISLVILAVLGLSFVPAEKIAAIATREVSDRTGREVSFTGKIKPVFFPVLGVKTGAFSMANADWSNQGPMLSAESVLVGVELWPLLSGEVRVKDFRLVRPVVLLEKSTNGLGNWQLSDSVAPSSDTSGGDTPGLAAISIRDGRIQNGSLRYIDHMAGAETSLTGLNLAIKMPDMNATATLKGDLLLNGETVSFDVTTGPVADLLAGKVIDFDLASKGGFGALSFKGAAGTEPVQADGMIDASIADMASVGRLAGLGADFADGLAKSATFSGKVTYARDGIVYLRGGEISLDKNSLKAEADLRLESTPFLTAKLTAGDLDFSAFASNGSDDGSGADTAGWSRDKLDLSGLHTINADVAFAARSLNLGAAKLGETRVRLRLDKGRLVTSLSDVIAYDGRLNGDFVVNARNGISMGGDLSVSGMQLQPLLQDMAEYDRLIASASGQLKFLTSGSSMDAMMRKLSGSGRMDVGAGELIGLDLFGMLRNLDASYRGAEDKTIFSAISGSFAIANGVLANEDLNFQSPLVRATGKGNVDIGAQTVDYRIEPVAFSGEDLEQAGGISVPVLIQGPWSNLSYQPDLGSLFDAELTKQREAAEAQIQAEIDKAKADAEARLQEQVDRAVEDALGDVLKQLTGQE